MKFRKPSFEEFRRTFPELDEKSLRIVYDRLYPDIAPGTRVRHKLSGRVGRVHYTIVEPLVSVAYGGSEFGMVPLRCFSNEYEVLEEGFTEEELAVLRKLSKQLSPAIGSIFDLS